MTQCAFFCHSYTDRFSFNFAPWTEFYGSLIILDSLRVLGEIERKQMLVDKMTGRLLMFFYPILFSIRWSNIIQTRVYECFYARCFKIICQSTDFNMWMLICYPVAYCALLSRLEDLRRVLSSFMWVSPFLVLSCVRKRGWPAMSSPKWGTLPGGRHSKIWSEKGSNEGAKKKHTHDIS